MKKTSNSRKTLKRTLASILAVMMLATLYVAMPIAAEELQTDTFAEIREKTNLVLFGGANFEEDDTSVLGGWTMAGAASIEVSSDQAYEGESSALHKYSATGDYYYRQIPGCEPEKTYLATAMILGTEKNSTVTDNALNTQWSKRFQMNLVNSSTVTKLSDYRMFPQVLDMVTASASDSATQVKADKSEWKRTSAIFETNATSPANVWIAVQPFTAGVEFYSDDYYCGELMVAEVEASAEEDTIAVPSSGITEVNLSATALNQIGTTDGLTGTTYTWKINGNVPGVTVEDSILKVASSARPGEVSLTVTANPTFTGADNQNDYYKGLRSADITVNITALAEEEKLDAYRKANNLLTGLNPGAEDESISQWQKHFNSNDTLTIERSGNQSYEGDYSVLIKQGKNGDFYGYHYPKGLPTNKTYIASAMVLGTEANTEAVNSDPYPNLEQYRNNFHINMATLANGTAPTFSNTYGQSEKNWVAMSSMIDASASSAVNQVKADKDDWQRLDNIIVINDKTPYYVRIGAAVSLNGAHNVEFYADDYYLGELVVADVRNTTEESVVEIPESGNSTLELSAVALNQLGNTKYLGNVTYEWNILSAPDGVEIAENTLTVPAGTKRGTAVITVTATPDFVGSETQTDSQKALRTKTIFIDIAAETQLDYTASASKVTPVAYINALGGEVDSVVYSALYKNDNGSLKLMNIVSKEINVSAGKIAEVNLPELTIPSYDYKIKSFMWKNDDKLQAIIPALDYSK